MSQVVHLRITTRAVILRLQMGMQQMTQILIALAGYELGFLAVTVLIG